ncbi:MAG: molybdopterin-dependent oxidoreductase [Actinomycetota bacterium]
MVRKSERDLAHLWGRLEKLRQGPLRAGAFRSELHTQRIGALLGIALGVSFSICFATGLLSHLIQQPPAWFEWPSRPAGLYRITQGLHVFTGLVSIPLLLGKLWAVYPRLWMWPPITGLLHLVERVSLVPLVAGSLFLVATGLFNIAYWYPFGFFFPTGHYWAAWITVGALIVHIGAKIVLTTKVLGRAAPPETTAQRSSRRAFLSTIAATSGVVLLTTVGETLRPLSRLAVLAPRRPDFGPQDLPVNKSAAGARVLEVARDPGYRLAIEGNVARPLQLSLDDLRALAQHEARLPIACVEGWSVEATWRGVRVRDLLAVAGAPDEASVGVESLQPSGLYRRSELSPAHAHDRDTLLALEVNRMPLHIDHGFPLRLIGPNRPGVMQTKWVSKLVVA